MASNLEVGTLLAKASEVSVTPDTNADNLVVEENGNAGISIISGTSNTGNLTWGDTTNNMAAISYSHDTNNMSFRVNATNDILTLDSAGNVQIGGDGAPFGKLEVAQATAFTAVYNAIVDNIVLTRDATTGSGNYGGSIGFSPIDSPNERMAAIASVQTAADTNQMGLAFFTHPSATGGADIVEALRIDHAGHVTITSPDEGGISFVAGANQKTAIEFGDPDDTNVGRIAYDHNNDEMGFLTNAGTKLTIDSAGLATFSGGINLGDTTLSNYEEGSWTPQLTDGTNDATMSGTYNAGRFIRVGNMVTVTGFCVTTALGSVSGNIKIGGLPYDVHNTYGALNGSAAGSMGGGAITAGQTVTMVAELNSDKVRLELWDVTTGTSSMQESEWTDDGNIQFALTYFTEAA